MIKESDGYGAHSSAYTHNRPTSKKPPLTLADLLFCWQEANRIRLKPASVSRYQNLIDAHILPFLGNRKVCDLTPSYLNSFIASKLTDGRIDGKGGLSPAYVRSIALVIDAAIKYGAATQLCAPLRCALIKPPPAKREVLVLSRESQELLESYLLTEINEEKLLTYIALYTGLRIGEALALCWEDIDWKNQLLHVRHTVSRIWQKNDGQKQSVLIIDKPKTRTSQRIIPLCSKLFSLLKEYSRRKASGYILMCKNSFVSPRTFEYRYKKILKMCGLPPSNFHILRHTFATRCIEANVDIKSLSEILGHSDTSITLNTYVHSSLELKRRQLEKIV